jgi:hypothetical protein
MIGPAIVTWMEQGHEFFRNRIAALGSRRFLQGACDACEGKVLGTGGPSGGARPNMIHMKGGFLRCLG